MNDSSSNTEWGIVVWSGSTGTVLAQNDADRNGFDGISVNNSLTELAKNHADFNGDLGIEAVAGVTDLGGNTAKQNGNPLECSAAIAC